MQSLDVQVQKPVHGHAASSAGSVHTAGNKLVPNGKTGAETARNGSSFLAMIEKMIAGTKDGKADRNLLSGHITTGRGAGDATAGPGDGNTLIKHGSGMLAKNAGKQKPKTDAAHSGLHQERKKVAGDALGQKTETAPAGLAAGDTHGSRHEYVSLRKNGEADAFKTEQDAGVHAAPAKKNVRTGSGIQDASFAVPGMQPAVQALHHDSVKNGKSDGRDSTEVKAIKTGPREKKAMIGVRDERTSNNDASAVLKPESPLVKSVQVNNDGTADMSIGFKNASGTSVLSDNASNISGYTDAEKGQSFASMLSQELRSNAADFVKTGHIILRDNNSGLIRLTLHPESLGNVNISLELSDKKISGKIHVSSQEAYDAFNENLDGLSQAFVQGGFESAGFDLSWSGAGGSGFGKKEETGMVSSPFYASSIPDVMSAADTADTQMSGSLLAGSSAINVFA